MPRGIYIRTKENSGKNKGMHWKLSNETRTKFSRIHKGKIFSEETRRKISEAKKGKKRIDMIGSKNPSWVFDRTKLKTSRKHCYDTNYRIWMKAVKDRDNWKCKIADENCGGRLESHHILGWKDYPELRFIVNNGITLCKNHHPFKREDEKRLSPFFQELINNKI